MPHPSVVLLADDLFSTYLSAIRGAMLDSKTGLVEIPSSTIASMHPLEFVIGGKTFTMDVASQLFPTDENTALGGEAGKRYGVVGNLGDLSGAGLDFILGQKFLERYYSVSRRVSR